MINWLVEALTFRLTGGIAYRATGAVKSTGMLESDHIM